VGSTLLSLSPSDLYLPTQERIRSPPAFSGETQTMPTSSWIPSIITSPALESLKKTTAFQGVQKHVLANARHGQEKTFSALVHRDLTAAHKEGIRSSKLWAV